VNFVDEFDSIFTFDFKRPGKCFKPMILDKCPALSKIL
jgi:hypothetical protein